MYNYRYKEPDNYTVITLKNQSFDDMVMCNISCFSKEQREFLFSITYLSLSPTPVKLNIHIKIFKLLNILFMSVTYKTAFQMFKQ